MTRASPLPPTIPHAARDAAARWPDLAAVIDGERTVSFARLWADSRAAASALIARGIGAGDRVAIWAPNGYGWIVAAIGAMCCGAAIVPLNTRLKGREAGDILRRARVRLLFTVGDFLGNDYPALLADETLPALDGLVKLDTGLDAFLASGRGAGDPRVDAALDRIGPDTLSDIPFTSGTTGAPKGVLMTHGRVLPPCAEWIANCQLRHGDRYLIANPFFHAFGTKVGWVACLLVGATAVPMASFDVEAAVAAIERLRISFLPGPPTIFQMLLARKEERDFDGSSLRGGTTGAATVPPSLVTRIRDELGIADIVTAYGMTECVIITSCRPGDPALRIAQTCGTAIHGSEVRIADADGRTLGVGETGEILVRGNGVMLGYLDDPDATAAAIDADGWLHTGDVGALDADQYLRITDRKKDMYICGGFNVYPAEVERLLAAHPDIAQVAVIGIPDTRLGEVGKAFVVPRATAAPTAADLLAWARENMANYKSPREIAFVERLPINAAGKVVKSDLPM
ncbi:FadD3 family acyl-CoA ligase [Sphingomonas sp.]|uniref:FadD3 family acyl-CoA ligase n=1 Tax=Sphingomonas sp. TaxID=28214 RepID=UPI001EC0F224|nr:FadD3 family acyl-CoA ligase [Sphingomonas sp.]MBX3594711.1 FadD3 family acyl-CoA ligase [Sphingomonas sp.]